jgi:hypothetical protein
MPVPNSFDALCCLCDVAFYSKSALDQHCATHAELHHQILYGGNQDLGKREVHDPFREDWLLAEMFDTCDDDRRLETFPEVPDLDDTFIQIDERETHMAGEAIVCEIEREELVKSIFEGNILCRFPK